MSAKKQAYKAAYSAPEPVKAGNPLIKTVSEVEKLTLKEKEAFRKAGGTAISNPI
jgi:hypothetical protein